MSETNKPYVLLVNTGSPDEPEAPAVRRYLRQFLSDRRIIETHPVLWRPILEGIILRVRPKRSAAKYRMIWGEHGSPLVHFTRAQADHLRATLGQDADVGFAMSYGQPGIADTLDEVYSRGHRRVLVVPMFPQYSATTVAAINDQVSRWSLQARDHFEWRHVRSFPTHPGYVEALASAIESRWAQTSRPNFDSGDRLLISYHSIPSAMVAKGDPYPEECQATTRLLAERLGLDSDHFAHTYQSKFGPASWLSPATIDTVAEHGRNGTARVDVVCPGFVSDCLETLEEIDMENRVAFTGAGGAEFNYLPWGNDSARWLDALEGIVRDALAGWIPNRE